MNMHHPYKFWRGRQVFHDLKCIFIHIPKNGGGSVRLALSPNKNYGGHTSLLEYKNKLPPEHFNYFKFAFTRNPYERFISAYKYLKRRIDTQNPRFTPHISKEEVKDFHSFTNMAKTKLLTITHIRPQYLFLIDENDNIGVDFLGKFENFQEDFNKVCKMLNIKTNLPHLHKSKNKPEITDELNTIKSLYRRDYELFYPEELGE